MENVFAGAHDIQQFFASAGFAFEEYRLSETLARLSSIKRQHLGQAEILTIRQILNRVKTLILTTLKA